MANKLIEFTIVDEVGLKYLVSVDVDTSAWHLPETEMSERITFEQCIIYGVKNAFGSDDPRLSDFYTTAFLGNAICMANEYAQLKEICRQRPQKTFWNDLWDDIFHRNPKDDIGKSPGFKIHWIELEKVVSLGSTTRT